MRYLREQRLVEYYDKHVQYKSSSVAHQLIAARQSCEDADLTFGADDWIYDVGCGDGRGLMTLVAFFGCNGLGVDCSPARIAKAKSAISAQNWTNVVKYEVGDVYDVPTEYMGRFKLITVFEVLEHLVDPVGLLAVLRERLLPGGRIVGSVPIRMPGPTHLQVFKSPIEVTSRLGGYQHFIEPPHAFFDFTYAS